MLHHSKAGKPRKGPQQAENTASVAKPLLLGNVGVSLHTCAHPGLPCCSQFYVVSVPCTPFVQLCWLQGDLSWCLLKMLLPGCFVPPASL